MAENQKHGKKFKKRQSSFEMPVVTILLENTHYDFDSFAMQFMRKWHLSIEPYREENALGIIVDGMVVACALIPSPASDAGLFRSAAENVLWQDAEAVAAKHAAQLAVTMTQARDPISAHILFSMVIHSLLKPKNTLGVYMRPGLLEAAYYIKCAEEISDGELPTELWVHINSSDTPDGLNFCTSGMRKFGKEEFEILGTKKNFIDAYYFLKEVIRYTIRNDVVFKNGETLGSDEQSKVTVTVSEGVYIKGTSIKLAV